MNAITPFTAETEAVANVLAVAYEELELGDLHPGVAVRYLDLAGDLTKEDLPRDVRAIGEVIALRMEDVGNLDRVAPWDWARHLDVAYDVLALIG